MHMHVYVCICMMYPLCIVSMYLSVMFFLFPLCCVVCSVVFVLKCPSLVSCVRHGERPHHMNPPGCLVPLYPSRVRDTRLYDRCELLSNSLYHVTLTRTPGSWPEPSEQPVSHPVAGEHADIDAIAIQMIALLCSNCHLPRSPCYGHLPARPHPEHHLDRVTTDRCSSSNWGWRLVSPTGSPGKPPNHETVHPAGTRFRRVRSHEAGVTGHATDTRADRSRS